MAKERLRVRGDVPKFTPMKPETPIREVPDPELAALFLIEYEKCGTIWRAAEAIGKTYKTIQIWKSHDPEFREQMQHSYEAYKSRIEAEIHRRGVDGVEEEIFDRQGNVIGTKLKYSDQLLLAMAKRHIPEYRDSSAPSRLDAPQLDLSGLSREERDMLDALLEKAAMIQIQAPARTTVAEIQKEQNEN